MTTQTKPFKKQSLTQHQTIGEILSSTREGMHVTLEECAKQLRISRHYLEALERGAYNDLPSPVYIKNYLRLYAQALDIPWKRIAERYEKEIASYHHADVVATKSTNILQGSKKRARAKQSSGISHHRKALVVPRLLKWGAFGILIFVLIVYFVYSVVRLISPPPLAITNPEEDVIVTDRTIIIMGYSEPEVTVEINGQGIPVEASGQFAEEVTLHEGLNTIQISAKTKLSREQTVIRNILYNTSQEKN